NLIEMRIIVGSERNDRDVFPVEYFFEALCDAHSTELRRQGARPGSIQIVQSAHGARWMHSESSRMLFADAQADHGHAQAPSLVHHGVASIASFAYPVVHSGRVFAICVMRPRSSIESTTRRRPASASSEHWIARIRYCSGCS